MISSVFTVLMNYCSLYLIKDGIADCDTLYNSCILAIVFCTFYYVVNVILTLIFVFFGFNQKTAYELRISDWSSDVCSSDLAGHRRPATPGRRAARAARGPATDIRPRRTDPLRRSGGADRGKRRDPDRRRGRHRVAGHRGWDPFRLAPRRSRRRRDRRAPPACRALPDAGRGGRRAALPHQARAALVVRSRTDGLAVRPAARHPAAAVGGAAGLLPQARRLIDRKSTRL